MGSACSILGCSGSIFRTQYHRRNDFACAPGEIRAPWRSLAFENTAVRLLEDILSLPKTSEQNTSSRFPIVDGKTSIWIPASAFFVDNEEG
jgi:hypothetical protein